MGRLNIDIYSEKKTTHMNHAHDRFSFQNKSYQNRSKSAYLCKVMEELLIPLDGFNDLLYSEHLDRNWLERYFVVLE